MREQREMDDAEVKGMDGGKIEIHGQAVHLVSKDLAEVVNEGRGGKDLHTVERGRTEPPIWL